MAILQRMGIFRPGSCKILCTNDAADLVMFYASEHASMLRQPRDVSVVASGQLAGSGAKAVAKLVSQTKRAFVKGELRVLDHIWSHMPADKQWLRRADVALAMTVLPAGHVPFPRRLLETSTRAFDTYEWLFEPCVLVTEFRGDNLWDAHCSQLTACGAKEVCLQLVAAVVLLHAMNVAHLDLKPSNVLLDHNTRGDKLVTVIDFDVSEIVVDGAASTLSFFAGTHGSVAPEVEAWYKWEAAGTSDWGPRPLAYKAFAADMYGLGCVLKRICRYLSQEVQQTP